ncbi:hypothetical protein JOQ06_019995, partial [Pogonophryne albipinna]
GCLEDRGPLLCSLRRLPSSPQTQSSSRGSLTARSPKPSAIAPLLSTHPLLRGGRRAGVQRA